MEQPARGGLHEDALRQHDATAPKQPLLNSELLRLWQRSAGPDQGRGDGGRRRGRSRWIAEAFGFWLKAAYGAPTTSWDRHGGLLHCCYHL